MVGAGDGGVKDTIPANSTGWTTYDEALKRNSIVGGQAEWYMTWVRRFKKASPAVPLGDRKHADVERYLSTLLADGQISSRWIDQASEALRILFQEVIGARWSHPWSWPACPTAHNSPAKKDAPAGPASRPEAETPLVRLRAEIRAGATPRRPSGPTSAGHGAFSHSGAAATRSRRPRSWCARSWNGWQRSRPSRPARRTRH